VPRRAFRVTNFRLATNATSEVLREFKPVESEDCESTKEQGRIETLGCREVMSVRNKRRWFGDDKHHRVHQGISAEKVNTTRTRSHPTGDGVLQHNEMTRTRCLLPGICGKPHEDGYGRRSACEPVSLAKFGGL